MSMSLHWSDNVHTTAFTPRDYQVELAAAAKEKNIIICLGHNSSKEFIALKLLHEKGYELRRQENKKTSLYISYDGESTYNLLFHLSDLKVLNINKSNRQDVNWEKIIENCHKRLAMAELHDIFSYYSDSPVKPKILALAGPLHNPGCQLAHLNWNTWKSFYNANLNQPVIS